MSGGGFDRHLRKAALELRRRRSVLLVDLARQRGLGVHLIDPYYEKAPSRSGLLLGFAALSVKQLHAATRVLGACLADTAGVERSRR